MLRTAVKVVHRWAAIVTYAAALVSIYLGIAPYNKKKPWNQSNLSWGWVAGMLVGAAMVITAPSARAALAARMAALAAKA